MNENIGRQGSSKRIREPLSVAEGEIERDRPELYEFGPFRLEPAERKLLRANDLVFLAPKAFDTLVLLVRNSGHLLEKDELIRALWPDSFVEEGNLTNNISLLRKALGDDPAYIETVPKRGYRFVGAVRQLPKAGVTRAEEGREPQSLPVCPPAPLEELNKHEPSRISRLGWRRFLISAAAVLLLAAAWRLLQLRSAPPSVAGLPSFRQLTNDGRAKQGPLVVDGSRIFFTENLPGPQLVLASASGRGGETTMVANHFKQPMWADLSPDRSELLVLASESEAPYSMWIMSTAGGSPRSVGTLEVDDASWCRDSKTIVYSVGPEIYLVSEAGTANRKLATAPGRVSRLRWSPDGRTLRFTVTEQNSDRTSLWQLSGGGPDLRALLPDWDVSSSECCGTWTPDGKYFVFQSTRDGRTDIWAIPEKGGFWGNREGSPIPITSGPMNFTDPTFSDDAKKLFVVGISPRAEIVRHDSATGDFVPYLPGISAEGIAVSRDGEWLTYVAYPEGTVWRCKADGSARLQLTFPPLRPLLPRWSPDGKQIVFFANSPAKPWKIYVVSSEGGPPQQLMPGDQQEGDPTWSSDGSSIVFGGVPWYPNSEVTIGVFDLESRRVSKLPQSDGLFSPRSSPTGRYIAALNDSTHDLMLFDSQANKWTRLIGPQINYPSFSRDGKYIYFQDWRDYSQSDGRPLRGGLVRVCRIRLSDRKIESLFDIKGIASVAIGTIMPWSGLAQDDSPLLARDISSQELYSLDWPLH